MRQRGYFTLPVINYPRPRFLMVYFGSANLPLFRTVYLGEKNSKKSWKDCYGAEKSIPEVSVHSRS